MKFPDRPRKGLSIEQSFNQLLDWCWSNRVTGINGTSGVGSSNGKTFSIPVGGGVPSSAPAPTIIPPLTLVTSRPGYVPEPLIPVPEGHSRYFLTWGTTNGTLADNWGDCVDLAVTSEETFYIAMKAFLNPTSADVVVPTCEWITYTEAQRETTGYFTPDFGNDGSRPEYMIIELAQVIINSDLAVFHFSIGGGSLNLRQYVNKIDFQSGKPIYQQALGADRILY